MILNFYFHSNFLSTINNFFFFFSIRRTIYDNNILNYNVAITGLTRCVIQTYRDWLAFSYGEPLLVISQSSFSPCLTGICHLNIFLIKYLYKYKPSHVISTSSVLCAYVKKRSNTEIAKLSNLNVYPKFYSSEVILHKRNEWGVVIICYT